MSTPLRDEEIRSALEGLPGWSFGDDRISKTFEFKHFREAMSFMVRAGFEAEEMNHHPEFRNVYNRVTVSLNTHDAGGKVTARDIVLAGKIEHFCWVD